VSIAVLVILKSNNIEIVFLATSDRVIFSVVLELGLRAINFWNQVAHSLIIVTLLFSSSFANRSSTLSENLDILWSERPFSLAHDLGLASMILRFKVARI